MDPIASRHGRAYPIGQVLALLDQLAQQYQQMDAADRRRGCTVFLERDQGAIAGIRSAQTLIRRCMGGGTR